MPRAWGFRLPPFKGRQEERHPQALPFFTRLSKEEAIPTFRTSLSLYLLNFPGLQLT
jgi:hypothetical protein